MNVADNLNSVYVINKPCMSSRRMSLLPRATLQSDSEQAQQSLVLQNQSTVSFYIVLTLILWQAYCVGTISPTRLPCHTVLGRRVQHCLYPLLSSGHSPHPPSLAAAGGTHSDKFVIIVGPIAQHAVGYCSLKML